MGTLKNVGRVVKGTAKAVKGTAKITAKIVKGTAGLFASSSNSSQQQPSTLQATSSNSNKQTSDTTASSSKPNTLDRRPQEIYSEEVILEGKTATELYAILCGSNEQRKKYYQPLVEQNIERLVPTGEPLLIAPHSIGQRQAWTNRIMLIALVLLTAKKRGNGEQKQLLQRLFDAGIDQQLSFQLSNNKDQSLLKALLASTLVSLWMLNIEICSEEHLRNMICVLFKASDAGLISKSQAEEDILTILLVSDFGEWLTPDNPQTPIDRQLLHFWNNLGKNSLLTHPLLVPFFLPQYFSDDPMELSAETHTLIVQKLEQQVILLTQDSRQLRPVEREQLSRCLTYLSTTAWNQVELTPQFTELLQHPKRLAVLDEELQMNILITLLAQKECIPDECGYKECSNEECIMPYVFERIEGGGTSSKLAPFTPLKLMKIMGLDELALKFQIACISQTILEGHTKKDASAIEQGHLLINTTISAHNASPITVREKINLIRYVHEEHPVVMDKTQLLAQEMEIYADNQEMDSFLRSALQILNRQETPKTIKNETCISVAHQIAQGTITAPEPIITGTTAVESDLQRSIFAYQFLLGNDSPDAAGFRTLYDLILSQGHIRDLDEAVPLWKPEILRLLIAFYQNPKNILIPQVEFKRLFIETLTNKMLLLISDERYNHLTTELLELAAQYDLKLFKSFVFGMSALSADIQMRSLHHAPQGPYNNVLFYIAAQHPGLFRPFITSVLRNPNTEQISTLFNQPSLNRETSLVLVLLLGTEEQLRQLINLDVNINQLDANLDTLLHHAIKNGNTPLVEQLLTKNADINTKNMQQMHALEMAIVHQPKYIKPILRRLTGLPVEAQILYLLNLPDLFYDIVLEDFELLSVLITLSSFNLDLNNPTELNHTVNAMDIDTHLQKFGAQYLNMKEKSRTNAKYTEAASATKTLLIECIKAKITLFESGDTPDIKISTFKRRYSDAIETARTVLSHYREWGKWLAYAVLPISLPLYGLGFFSFKTNSEQSLDELNQKVVQLN